MLLRPFLTPDLLDLLDKLENKRYPDIYTMVVLHGLLRIDGC